MISQLMFDQQYDQSIKYEMENWLSEVDWGSVKSKIRSLAFYFGNLINAELEMFSYLNGVMLAVILQHFASHSDQIFLGA